MIRVKEGLAALEFVCVRMLGRLSFEGFQGYRRQFVNTCYTKILLEFWPKKLTHLLEQQD